MRMAMMASCQGPSDMMTTFEEVGTYIRCIVVPERECQSDRIGLFVGLF